MDLSRAVDLWNRAVALRYPTLGEFRAALGLGPVKSLYAHAPNIIYLENNLHIWLTPMARPVDAEPVNAITFILCRDYFPPEAGVVTEEPRGLAILDIRLPVDGQSLLDQLHDRGLKGLGVSTLTQAVGPDTGKIVRWEIEHPWNVQFTFLPNSKEDEKLVHSRLQDLTFYYGDPPYGNKGPPPLMTLPPT